MFFQSIYQMITAGTDLNINIRKVDNSLSVAVMPRRNSLKEDTRQNMVPLVVNGTPAEQPQGGQTQKAGQQHRRRIGRHRAPPSRRQHGLGKV